jgi:hypothetical protein
VSGNEHLRGKCAVSVTRHAQLLDLSDRRNQVASVTAVPFTGLARVSLAPTGADVRWCNIGSVKSALPGKATGHGRILSNDQDERNACDLRE